MRRIPEAEAEQVEGNEDLSEQLLRLGPGQAHNEVLAAAGELGGERVAVTPEGHHGFKRPRVEPAGASSAS